MITELNNENFSKETKNGVKLVEFYTAWCGYCKKQQPELESMDKIWIGQIDADKNSKITSEYEIDSFPTFLILKNGKEIERFNGLHKKEDLISRIIKYV